MDSLDEELHFLILRYLEEGPCKNAAKVLKEEVEKYELLPKRIDWEGKNYPHAYHQLVTTHPHVAADHLKRICSRLPGLLDEKFPPSVRGVQSLLGAGSQSLLRSEKMRSVHGAEYTGIRRHADTQPVEIYGNYQLQRRFLGHLSAVYCVLYDRTGNYIFTGADDKLVKIWSALTGRLLASLRGHDGEIVDLSVNYENTLLASGSCDKLVRIWCLKTTVCLAVLHGHTATVTSLQFCPLVKGNRRYLVSTGEDATVCFWHYCKATKVFESRPIKFIERSRTGAKMLTSSFSSGGLFLATGNTDSVIRIYCLLGIQPEKIGELEAHSDMVDSIQYSNHSDRFISGSKDGTARIWRHMRNEWLNLILTMKPENATARGGADVTGGALKVNMVAWTSDDDYVLTAVSDFSVRVWCSTTGLSIRSLKGHEDDVFVIECATFNNNLVVTAGHDGRIKLWDLKTGRTLMNYYNMIDGQGFGAVYDCKWSPHNHSFSTTDSHGHLMRFGVGQNDRLSEEKIPTELYFHTDYRRLIRDANDHVLDELTQRAVHLLPPPFLVDVDAIPYPPKYQKLVPGREHLPEQFLKALHIDLPNGDREVIDQEIPLTLRLPTATQAPTAQPSTSNLTTIQSETTLAETSQSLDSRPSTSLSLSSTLSTSQSHEADADAGSTSQVRPAAGPVIPTGGGDVSNNINPYLREVIPDMNEQLLRAAEQARAQTTEVEQKEFISEIKRRPFLDDERLMSSGSEAVYLRTRKRRPANYRTRTVKKRQEQIAGEQAVRNRLTTRALYDTDVESEGDPQEFAPNSRSGESSSSEEPEVHVPRERRKMVIESDGMQSDGGSYNGATSCSDSANSSSDYSDWEVDHKTNLQPPSRKSQRKVGPPRTHSPNADTPTKASKVAARKKSSIKRVTRARRKAKRIADSIVEASSVSEIGDATLVPEWLTTDMPHKSPYFPQMGDELIYFFQGHMSYVQEVEKQNLYKQSSKLPWDKIHNLREQELVRVTGIKIVIICEAPKIIRLCCLKLAVIYPDSKKQSGTTFTVKYHDMAGVIDFLVLRQFYDIAQQRNWLVGDRFRSIIDDKWWSGTVIALEPYDPQYSDSQFLCLKVKWDDGSEDCMSPWDLEPLADDEENVMLKGTDITSEDRLALQYVPEDQEWPECGREQECLRISRCIEQLMGYSVSEPFTAPVDLNEYPDYTLSVAYPIDLSCIRARLENGFYRRVAPVYFDVRYIQQNAELYNCPKTQIVRKARIVSEVCVGIIKNTSCEDTQSVYATIDLDHEFYAVDSKQAKGKSKKKSGKVSWKEAVQTMVDQICEYPDFAPFRAPVDLGYYTDYNEMVPTPMDLGTIREYLECDTYNSKEDVFNDLKLIISNSRKYNVNRHSTIYNITTRLKSMLDDKIKNISHDLRKNARNPTSNIRSTKNSNRFMPDDPLTRLPSGSSPRKTRHNKHSEQAGASTSSYSNGNHATRSSNRPTTSHYSTRQSTGRLKPKQFGDDILLTAGSFVQVSKKARKIEESSEDEQISYVGGSRNMRAQRAAKSRPVYDDSYSDNFEEDQSAVSESPAKPRKNGATKAHTRNSTRLKHVTSGEETETTDNEVPLAQGSPYTRKTYGVRSKDAIDVTYLDKTTDLDVSTDVTDEEESVDQKLSPTVVSTRGTKRTRSQKAVTTESDNSDDAQISRKDDEESDYDRDTEDDDDADGEYSIRRNFSNGQASRRSSRTLKHTIKRAKVDSTYLSQKVKKVKQSLPVNGPSTRLRNHTAVGMYAEATSDTDYSESESTATRTKGRKNGHKNSKNRR